MELRVRFGVYESINERSFPIDSMYTCALYFRVNSLNYVIHNDYKYIKDKYPAFLRIVVF